MADYPCSTPKCPGDGRYMPPGRGHLPGCAHDAVKAVWGPGGFAERDYGTALERLRHGR
jgi:hypothetical protein